MRSSRIARRWFHQVDKRISKLHERHFSGNWIEAGKATTHSAKSAGRYGVFWVECLHAPKANISQPRMKAPPPRGVTA